MDTISFELEKFTDSPSGVTSYNVMVYLNSVILAKSLFTPEILVGVKPTARIGKFGLYTCSCGVPECAGYYDDISFERTNTSVKWTFTPDSGYHPEKLVYEFDAGQFESAVSGLYQEMISLEKQNIHLETFLCDIEDDPQAYIQHFNKTKKGIDYFISKVLCRFEQFAKDLETIKQVAPDFSGKFIAIRYKHHIEKVLFNDIVYRLAQLSPYYTWNPEYAMPSKSRELQLKSNATLLVNALNGDFLSLDKHICEILQRQTDEEDGPTGPAEISAYRWLAYLDMYLMSDRDTSFNIQDVSLQVLET